MLQKVITLLFLSGDPMPMNSMAGMLGAKHEEIEALLPEISKALDAVGLSLLRAGDEISIVTKASEAALVESFWKEELKGELTPATLQVLTLVAYLQNPTREEVSYIRGVQSSQSIRTLAVRGLISREGERCLLTGDALKHLGITKVEELPEYERIHKELREKLEGRNT